jgi:hypothetical protein
MPMIATSDGAAQPEIINADLLAFVRSGDTES